jgi:hypothetical protein
VIAAARERIAFRKVLDRASADAEVRGWQAVSRTLPVPELLGRTRAGGKHLVAYEDIFANGRCTLLLGDLIGAADRDPALLPQVTALIDAACDSLLDAVRTTGGPAPLSACVPGLYLDRIREGGLIEQRYLDADLTIPHPHTADPVPLRELTGCTLTVNGVRLRMDLPAAIADARAALAPHRHWITALTQGDPTEANIAAPLCWLDFQYAGRNTIPGEIAVLLWYLLGMGGWLVPRYQPTVYARTLPQHLPPVATPRLERFTLNLAQRRIGVRYSWPLGQGRAAALQRLLQRVRADLGHAAGLHPERALCLIRHFLAVRILGVIDPARMTGPDLLLLLAKLAELQQLHKVDHLFPRTSAATATRRSDQR